ncbi:MAG: hypothetical protein NC820_06435 [Candidatus Omnitrophica bacterium]|nr:hypothetical protein [Candidatus Omnitrophota bacterium]
MATKLHNNCEYCQTKKPKMGLKQITFSRRKAIHFAKKGRCLCRWDIEPLNITTKKNKVTCRICLRILLR